MGRALQGFGQEQGKGVVSCQPWKPWPPKVVPSPVTLGPGYPGADVGTAGGDMLLTSWGTPSFWSLALALGGLECTRDRV